MAQSVRLMIFVVQKAAASAFAQMLRRYTGLNHLAQAARTVLQNKAQVNKMHQDLCKVDFVHIQVIVCFRIRINTISKPQLSLFGSH